MLVPKDRVARLRMKLAEGGLPKGGGVGYEIFDKSDALGTTSFVQNINHLRALEGELARTIRALDRVQAARVHLVLPERPLFSRDKVEPSASIVLKVRGTLEPQQVRAIRHLVASAVNGLQAASGYRSSTKPAACWPTAPATIRTAATSAPTSGRPRSRSACASQVEAIVSSVVGPGRARVAGHRRFRLQPRHPDLGQIRSRGPRRALEPDARGNLGDQRRQGRPGHGRQRAARRRSASAAPGAANAAPRDQSRKSEEIVNYEISQTTKTEVIEGGRVNRVSVAVLVDGTYGKNDKGESTYQPRSKEEIDRIAALVRTAIGFDQKRGDQVEVVNLRFAETPATPITEPTGWLSLLQFTKDDIMRAIELVVMGLLGLVVLLLGGAAAGAPHHHAGRARRAGAAAGRHRRPPIAAAVAPIAGHRQRRRASRPYPSQTSKMIDIAQVQGQVHAQSVQKVGELADKNPNETVSIIRSWLHESAAPDRSNAMPSAYSRQDRKRARSADIASVVATLASRQRAETARRQAPADRAGARRRADARARRAARRQDLEHARRRRAARSFRS